MNHILYIFTKRDQTVKNYNKFMKSVFTDFDLIQTKKGVIEDIG